MCLQTAVLVHLYAEGIMGREVSGWWELLRFEIDRPDCQEAQARRVELFYLDCDATNGYKEAKEMELTKPS